MEVGEAVAASVEKRAVWRQCDDRGGAKADALAARSNIAVESEWRILDIRCGGKTTAFKSGMLR
jgi:hypothetical protein